MKSALTISNIVINSQCKDKFGMVLSDNNDQVGLFIEVPSKNVKGTIQ